MLLFPTRYKFNFIFKTAFWFGYTKLDAYIEQILPTWLALVRIYYMAACSY